MLDDSNYGNTRHIADAITKALGSQIISVGNVTRESLTGIDLLVVGCPINVWRPTMRMLGFLASLKTEQLKGMKAAAFDTRIKMFIHGDTAKKIARTLQQADATMVAAPQGFLVKGKEGPLVEGEIERAKEWTKNCYQPEAE